MILKEVPMHEERNEKSILTKLITLAESWENMARRKWADAEKEKDLMGKKLIEHGALCYQNCAHELRGALASLSPAVSAKEEQVQR